MVITSRCVCMSGAHRASWLQDRLFLSAPVPAGEVRKPPVDVEPAETSDLAYSLVRVLDDDGHAVGPWNPQLSNEQLLRGMRAMLKTRLFDAHAHRATAEKLSFYMQCLGEAIATAHTLALRDGDMCPTYRQQGILITREYPLVDMICQLLPTRPTRSRAASYRSCTPEQGGRFLLHLRQPRHPVHPGGRLGHGLGDQGRHAHRLGLDRRRRYRRVGLPHRPHLRPCLPRAGNPQRGQQPVGDLHLPGHRRRRGTTFANRGVGCGIASLRVDGNDFLAVYAASEWAAERARRNLGPSLIEWVTYRAGPHSTSDDPSKYRPADDWTNFPLGDPIARLKRHMIGLGIWSEEQHEATHKALRSRSTGRAETGGEPWHPDRRPGAERRQHVRGRLCRTAGAPAPATPGARGMNAMNPQHENAQTVTSMTMIQALRSAMDIMPMRDDDVVVFGQDVGYFGGVFRCTEGLQKKYGTSRVFDAPISERHHRRRGRHGCHGCARWWRSSSPTTSTRPPTS